MKPKTRVGGVSVRVLVGVLLSGWLAVAQGATLPLPFTNAPSITASNDLWQQITNSGYPTLYAGTTNDSKTFRGVFVANANSPDVKLALHSDDGSTVTIDGQPTGVADLGTDTHLKESSSLKMLSTTFVPGQQYCVQIQYSNQALTTNDQDGVTLYAYNGSGTVTFGPRVIGPDAICVGVMANFTADCGTAPYSWSNNTPTLISLSGSGDVTGLSSGTATITVRDAETNATARTVHVVKPGISPAFLTNCVGLTNTFVLTNSAGTGVVMWSQSGLLTGNTRTNQLAFNNAGTNILTATYAGCTVSATVTVVAVSSLLPATTNFCNSGTVVYTNQTTPPAFGNLVNWGGEGLFGTGSSRTNSYSGLGPHVVSNWCGTSVKYSTATVYRIDIAQTNALALADATATVNFNLTNSFGAATWQITPNPSGGASFSGGNTGDSVSINPGSVGTNYTITASADALPSCSDTATLQVVKVTFATNLVAFCEGTNASVAMTVSPSNFLSSLTFDTVTNVAAGTPNTVASVTVASTTNLILNPVSPGTATLRVRLGNSTFFGPVVKVVRVTFPTNAWWVAEGKSRTFGVTITPPDAPVTFTTKEPSIATAAGSGANVTVNGVTNGTTQVLAVVGLSTCVQKDVAVAKVTLSPDEIDLCIGDHATISATVIPGNAPVTFQIKNPTSAMITQMGLTFSVVSQQPGDTVLDALLDGEVADSTVVRNIRVTFPTNTIYVVKGASRPMTALVTPRPHGPRVTFLSTDTNVVRVSGSAPELTLTGVSNGTAIIRARVGTNESCSFKPVTVITLTSTFNGTTNQLDDFVVVTAATSTNRPSGSFTLNLQSGAGMPIEFTLTPAGPGRITFETNMFSLSDGSSKTVKVFGDAKSSAENDTLIQVRTISGKDGVLLEEDLTVITGIKVRFTGTFLFPVDNQNGQTFPFPTPCNGFSSPKIWANTPLPCEGLNPYFHQVIIEEGKTAAERWTLASGKRPKIEVLIVGIKAFGPEVSLDGRDSVLTNGTPVLAAAGNSYMARQITDDADDCPTTGNDDGQEDGIEPVLDFGCRFGDAFGLTYKDASPFTTARIWTKFPAFDTNDYRITDTNAVVNFFLPGGATGCTEASTVYVDANGYHCNQAQTLRQLLLRTAGFRTQTLPVWANWTTRKLVVTMGSRFSESFVAKLFNDAIIGNARNSNADPSDDVFAEAFLQYAGYDWFTLMGRFDKGVAATPDGVPPRFIEWTQSRTTPPPPPSPCAGALLPDYRPIPYLPGPAVPVSDDPWNP